MCQKERTSEWNKGWKGQKKEIRFMLVKIFVKIINAAAHYTKTIERIDNALSIK